MAEIGYQRISLPLWGDLAEEAVETNPRLQWPQSVRTFDQMRREDSQVGSVLRAVTHPIRRTSWMVDPADARPEAIDLVARSLGLPVQGREKEAPLRAGDKFDFDEHLRLALLELVYGHSVFEQVYEPDETGLVRLRKLAWRPPRTIDKWDVALDGGLIAIEQKAVLAGRAVRIPVDRLVVYVNEREGANWIGTSLLRTAYKNWLLKDRMIRAQALTVERNGLGIPVYKGAPLPNGGAGMTQAEIEDWHRTQREDGLKLAKSMRAGEDAGASIPNGSDLILAGVTGDLPDAGQAIQYHDEQIARAVLAHFLNLGSETGSWALGATFADFFVGSLNAIATHIANVLQEHVVEDLVALNWGPDEPAPRVVAATIGEEQPATADAIKTLLDCGAITRDDALEQYLRQRYKLPVKTETDAPTGDSGTAVELTDAEIARRAAETAQKVYLAVGPVLDKDEARHLVQRAGADITT